MQASGRVLILSREGSFILAGSLEGAGILSPSQTKCT